MTLTCGAAVNITNDLRDIQGWAYNAPVTFAPLYGWISNEAYIVNGPAKTFVPRQGILTATNIQPGGYKVTQGSRSLYISVDPGATGTLNLAQLATNGLTIYSGTIGSGFPGVAKVTPTDTSPNVLAYKIRAGANVALATNDPSGDATLVISATGGGAGGSADPNVITNYDTRALWFGNNVGVSNLAIVGPPGSNQVFRLINTGEELAFVREAGPALSLDYQDGNAVTAHGWLRGDARGITNITASHSILAGTISSNLLDAAAYEAFMLDTSSTYTNDMIIDVRDFGADGNDGGYDDDAAQAALDYAATNQTVSDGSIGHRIVYFPRGKYYFQRALLVKGHGVVVRGAGMWSTRLHWNTSTNAFVIDDSSHMHLGFESFLITTSFVPYTTAQAAAFYLARPSGAISAYRVLFRDVMCSGFFYGLFGRHIVGLRAERCEFYGLNYAWWMEKSDASVFVNCHSGDGYYPHPDINQSTNRFSFTNSVAYVYRRVPPNGTPGFSLSIFGGEVRGVDHVVVAESGVVNIHNTHVERVWSNSIIAGGIVRGGSISELSWTGIPTNNLSSPIWFRDGSAKNFRVGPMYWDAPARPMVAIGQANDYTHYSGAPIVITNEADGISYYMPFATNKVVVAAGENVTVTPSQSGPITTYTVAASGGGGSGLTFTNVFLDCTEAAQEYTLSERVPTVIIKSNANYDASIIGAGATNTVTGSLVWVDCQPIGSTNWILRW